MAFFELFLLNILENKRAKNFKNSVKCAYKPIIILIFRQKLNFAENVTYDLLAFNRRIILPTITSHQSNNNFEEPKKRKLTTHPISIVRVENEPTSITAVKASQHFFH